MADKIKVVTRFRDLTNEEKKKKVEFSSEITFHGNVGLTARNLSLCFDRVFAPHTKQPYVFQKSVNEYVDHLLCGYNCGVISYGQTASGKTYTMMGGEASPSRGLIPRSVDRILFHYKGRVRFTLVEIYMDKVRDLFTPNLSQLKMLGDGTIQNATVLTTRNRKTLFQKLNTANSRRKTAHTRMNANSSRSHSIFTIQLIDMERKPKMALVDLAGSEKASKTGASGNTLNEAGSINKSLTSLARIVHQLSSGSGAHVSFRESKLTQALQFALGGTAKTCLIVNCSPLDLHLPETIRSLQFGASAKSIAFTNVEEHVDPEEARLGKYFMNIKSIFIKAKRDGMPPFSEWEDLNNWPGEAADDQPWLGCREGSSAETEADIANLKVALKEILQMKKEVDAEFEPLDQQAFAENRWLSTRYETQQANLELFGTIIEDGRKMADVSFDAEQARIDEIMERQRARLTMPQRGQIN